MNANWSLPTLTSSYANFLAEMKSRDEDTAIWFDGVTSTNLIAGTKRWNSTGAKFEKFSGTAWNDLTTLYNINVATANNLNGGNNTTLLGAIHYQSNTNVTSLLPPNTAATRKFLRQLGTGTNGAVPVWDTIAASDVPTLNQNTTGSAAKLTTARNINGKAFDGTANINIEDRLGANIPSAAITIIGTEGLGNTLHITGTTTITSFGTASAAGVKRTLIFDGVLTLTNSANIICPGATNIVTVAGVVIEVVADTTTVWKVINIMHHSISFTELGFLDGATSNIQGQINGKAGTSLLSTEDLNNVVTSGFYRTQGTNANNPSFPYGQLIVSRGQDTIAQMIIDYSSATMKIRAGNPSTVGGPGGWTLWKTVAFTDSNITGNAATASNALGIGQSWQNLTASRVSSATYSNTTGRTIVVTVSTTNNTDSTLVAYVNGVEVALEGGHSQYGHEAGVTFVVPPSASYSVNIANSGLRRWTELR